MRGLKQKIKDAFANLKIVAPRVGAWIETNLPKPAQEAAVGSHPAWVRGLKQYRYMTFDDRRCVAPRVGAWIETGREVRPEHQQ